ncbi:MAG: GntR family transcriptional regulator [Evtepia sp.]
MELYISNSSGTPIYAQITDQIREKILNGTLREGDPLPSIRFLAKELRISVITTKRAYEDLEKADYIVTQAGRGSFVAKVNPGLCREETLLKVENDLRSALENAKRGGISMDEVEKTLRLLMEET